MHVTDEINWDLGPFAAVLAPDHISPGTTKYEIFGTKNYCMHAQLGHILDNGYKETKKPSCYFWRAWSKSRGSGAKAGYCTGPCTQHHLSGGQTTSATPLTQPWDTPYPHSIWRLSPPPPQESGKQGNQLFVLAPPTVAGAPVKPCLNFLSGLWSFFFFS